MINSKKILIYEIAKVVKSNQKLWMSSYIDKMRWGGGQVSPPVPFNVVSCVYLKGPSHRIGLLENGEGLQTFPRSYLTLT